MDWSADDESIDIELRAPEDVAARAIILAALAHRGFLEVDAAADDDPATDEDRSDLFDWLRDENLTELASPTELSTIRAQIGTLDPAEAASATWATEALAPLCWALGLAPALPPAEQPIQAESLLDLIPSTDSPTNEFIAGAQLIHEDEIARARESAELWHWRATVQELLVIATSQDRNDLVIAILETVEEGATHGLLPPPAQGDFPVNGQPYAVAPDPETLGMVAEWRLRALNWLCGFGDSWETVPLDP